MQLINTKEIIKKDAILTPGYYLGRWVGDTVFIIVDDKTFESTSISAIRDPDEKGCLDVVVNVKEHETTFQILNNQST
jgi:hypothetical protein